MNMPMPTGRAEVQPQRKMSLSVTEIAEAFSFPISGVHDMLSAEMKQLEREAKIQQYILLLSVKAVKDFLAASRLH